MPFFLNKCDNTFSETVEFVIEDCCTCGVPFAMTRQTKNERMANGESFYCPNGHSQHYTETTASRLEKELARERQKFDQVKAEVEYQKREREAAERRVVAAKGQITKVKKRFGNGNATCR